MLYIKTYESFGSENFSRDVRKTILELEDELDYKRSGYIRSDKFYIYGATDPEKIYGKYYVLDKVGVQVHFHFHNLEIDVRYKDTEWTSKDKHFGIHEIDEMLNFIDNLIEPDENTPHLVYFPESIITYENFGNEYRKKIDESAKNIYIPRKLKTLMYDIEDEFDFEDKEKMFNDKNELVGYLYSYYTIDIGVYWGKMQDDNTGDDIKIIVQKFPDEDEDSNPGDYVAVGDNRKLSKSHSAEAGIIKEFELGENDKLIDYVKLFQESKSYSGYINENVHEPRVSRTATKVMHELEDEIDYQEYKYIRAGKQYKPKNEINTEFMGKLWVINDELTILFHFDDLKLIVRYKISDMRTEEKNFKIDEIEEMMEFIDGGGIEDRIRQFNVRLSQLEIDDITEGFGPDHRIATKVINELEDNLDIMGEGYRDDTEEVMVGSKVVGKIYFLAEIEIHFYFKLKPILFVRTAEVDSVHNDIPEYVGNDRNFELDQIDDLFDYINSIID